jgi:alcohol dehydrogenase (cytochrome c)
MSPLFFRTCSGGGSRDCRRVPKIWLKVVEAIYHRVCTRKSRGARCGLVMNPPSIGPRRRRSGRTVLRIWVAILLIIVVTGMLGAVCNWRRFAGSGADVLESLTAAELWERLSWRLRLYGSKVAGGVPDLSWGELVQMSRHQGGFGMAAIFREGKSLDGSIRNPYTSAEDQQAGLGIFRRRCAGCHGVNGSGGSGPPLNRSGLRHGDSDLAIYKSLRDGIRGTSMRAAPLSPVERWQVVGYIRTLQMATPNHSRADASTPTVWVSGEELDAIQESSDNWLTYSGSFNGYRYSALDEVTTANVSQLKMRWMRQFDSEPRIQATPLVVNGVLFLTLPPSSLVAMDAQSGAVIWRYDRRIPTDVRLCCRSANRGLAALGDKVFMGSLDGYLVAIDAATGRVHWETRVADAAEGYSITGAPLIVKGLVVSGVAGGEYAIRGFLSAFEAATGQLKWRFYTIPGPGERGHETWENSAWRTGGGGTWVTGSFDPVLDLIYWGVGNPAPAFSGDVRPGDNLFTNSVIAVHADSGRLAWHFQFTPHDEHDWDSAQTPILADVPIKGSLRKVICWANRNGFYYVLDRVMGEFLAGTPFVEQNWAEGLTPHGRPLLRQGQSEARGRLIKPGSGGTNWQNPAYDRDKRLVFVPATEGEAVFTQSSRPRRGEGGFYIGSSGLPARPPIPVVRALDVLTGRKVWEYFSHKEGEEFWSSSGLLATRGGLVFGASGGAGFALDSATGNELWRVNLGGDTLAPPISFTVGGRQVIAVSAGRTLLLFGL